LLRHSLGRDANHSAVYTVAVVCLHIEQNTTCTTWGRGTDKKRATSFLNKRSDTQFYDWKPMRSIDILHKHFQEDHINARFPGFLNSNRLSQSCKHTVYILGQPNNRHRSNHHFCSHLIDHTLASVNLLAMSTQCWSKVKKLYR